MKTIDIFSTPICIEKGLYKVNENELQIINSFEYDNKAHLNFFSKDWKILNKLPNIKLAIENQLINYCHEILGLCDSKLIITNSWCTKTNKGGYHPSHSHPNSIISGVFYVNVGDNQNIIFQDEPQIFKKSNLLPNISKDTNYNTSKFAFPVNDGDLIMFPSALKHEVEINNTETTRLIIGFNTFLKGHLGNKNYPTELNL